MSQDLGAIFIEHRAKLRETAQQIVGTRDLAEDVTQSAYLKLLEITVAVDPGYSVGYCFQVVRNLAIDLRRRITLESQFFAPAELGETVPPAPSASPERAAIGEQHLMLVDERLSRLPLRTRSAFSLYRVNGLSQRRSANGWVSPQPW